MKTEDQVLKAALDKEKWMKVKNDWKMIKKARKQPTPFRVWLHGFILGILTVVVMSGLTWLAWRAF